MKFILKITGLLCLLLTFAFTSIDTKTVVIDVSHGGKDKGAHYENYNEKEIALNIASKVKALNKNTNINIILPEIWTNMLP